MGKSQTNHRPYGFYEKYIKRLLDIVCVLSAFLLLWWLFVIIAFFVRIKMGAPVLFTQQRVGKNEELFKLYKFRSMTNEKDKTGELLPDEYRQTKFGKFLRSTSLDEIPEFFNILKGDMSIVGPRPLIVRYLPYYTTEERHRHDVRPGLTGLAQVNGRDLLSWEERFAYDLQYVDHISFVMDCKLILITLKKVFERDDVLEKDNKSQLKTLSFGDLDTDRKNMVNIK